MDELYFLPYVPPRSSFDGTLVFANSHYAAPQAGKGRFGPGFFAILNQLAGPGLSTKARNKYWTRAQIGDVLGRLEIDQDPFYRRIRDVLCADRSTRVADCMRHIAFAVAVQELLPYARAARDANAASKSFYATLDHVRPKRVLVLGLPMWKQLHGNERWRVTADDGEISRFGEHVWATWCPHPAALQFPSGLVAARRRFRTVLKRAP